MSQLNTLFETKSSFCVGKISANLFNVIISSVPNSKLKPYYDYYRKLVCTNDGIYPYDDNVINEFCNRYMSELNLLDACAIWNTHIAFEKQLVNSSIHLHLREIEPYYWEQPWTSILKDKKVLVISSKTQSIKNNFKNKDLIWPNGMLPDFELLTLNFPDAYYMLDESKRVQLKFPSNANLLLDEYIEKMNNIDFDICLVGVGVFGLPLAIHAKKMNKIGIHLGGAIQILFGIKGGRWDSHDIISKFYNDHWTRPLPEETPKNHMYIENNCYW